MKTKAISILGLGLVFTFLCLTLQSPAKKPVKPDPPPEPDPNPAAVYQRVYPEPQPDHYGSEYRSGSINDSGTIAAMYLTTDYPADYCQRTVLLRPDATGTNYWASQAVVLNTNEVRALHQYLYINNNDQVAGLDCAWDDFAREEWWGEIWTNFNYRAVLWNNDGSRTYLWSADKTNESRSCAINDSGWVVIANFDDEGDDVTTGWPPILNSYVIVPVDVDRDGNVDWFFDYDGDGINDLALPIDTLGYTPMAINASGAIVFSEGLVLKPDYDDPNGNPWFADADGDNSNDLFRPLLPLGDNTSVSSYDINDPGEVVGSSGSSAVMWPSAELPPVDLGQPSEHPIRIYARHINNAGQIIGTYTDSHDYVGKGNTKVIVSRAFLYQEEQIHDFRDFVPDHGFGSYLNGINDHGSILCEYGYVYIPIDSEP